MTHAGLAWQDVLDHRVELADVPTGTDSAVWGLSSWDAVAWGAGWSGTFRDITPDLLHLHAVTGAIGLEAAAGIGTIEIELLNLEGRYSPDGDTGDLLGRHVRGFVTPAGRLEVPIFYGIVDKADATGTFTLPRLELTAYDVRSTIAATATDAPIGDQADTAEGRVRAILDAAGFPDSGQIVEEDPTVLLPDDTVDLGDLFDRTVASAAGLAWADTQGRVVYRGRDWIYSTADAFTMWVYAGVPPYGPDDDDPRPVAQTSGDLTATQATATIRNLVTYSNRADPPDAVTVRDAESIGRYGYHKSETTDLASPLDLLEALAAAALATYATPIRISDGATVTVYDADTAAAAGLQVGEMIVLGRNDPDTAAWEIEGIVASVELTISPEGFDVTLTVLELGTVGGFPASWDLAEWGVDRWQAPPVYATVWTMGPNAADALDAGNVFGGATFTLDRPPADELDRGNVLK